MLILVLGGDASVYLIAAMFFTQLWEKTTFDCGFSYTLRCQCSPEVNPIDYMLLGSFAKSLIRFLKKVSFIPHSLLIRVSFESQSSLNRVSIAPHSLLIISSLFPHFSSLFRKSRFSSFASSFASSFIPR